MDLCYHINTKHKDKVPEGWFTCSECDWSYTSNDKLNAHKICCIKGVPSNKNTKSSWIYCQYCPEVFVKNSQSFYFKHAKNFHFKDIKRDWFSCKQCKDSIYPTKKSLQKHQWYLAFVKSYYGVDGWVRLWKSIVNDYCSHTTFLLLAFLRDCFII